MTSLDLPPVARRAPDTEADTLVPGALCELEQGRSDGPALNQLARCLWPVLRGYVEAQGWGLADPEETAGEVLATVLARLPQFRAETGGCIPWVIGIARNVLRSQLRRERLREEPIETSYEAAHRDRFHLDSRLSVEQRRELLDAILGLPHEEYELLSLLLLEKQSATQVAKALALTPATVRKKKERLLDKLIAAAQTTNPQLGTVTLASK